jgi:3'-phosphoadenosine 5'-phosphosulfate sulfotransferase
MRYFEDDFVIRSFSGKKDFDSVSEMLSSSLAKEYLEVSLLEKKEYVKNMALALYRLIIGTKTEMVRVQNMRMM